jgi:hypothetical protein
LNQIANSNVRKIDRSSAISLGLAIALSLGAVTFTLRVPTEATIKVIVHEAVRPLEDKLNSSLVEMARLRALEDRVRMLEDEKRGGG